MMPRGQNGTRSTERHHDGHGPLREVCMRTTMQAHNKEQKWRKKKLPHTCGMQKYFDVKNSIVLSQASPPLQKNPPNIISRHIAPSLKIIRLSNYRQSNSSWPVSPCLPPCLGPASKVFHSKKRREKATTLAGRRRRRKQPWDFLATFSHLLLYFFSARELCFCFFLFL